MKLNGSAARKCASWIEVFKQNTDNLEAPEIYRQWAAITTLGATLEQKVWLQTSSALYPNLYVFLVGYPGVGKTRTIRAARCYANEVPEFYLAPTSVTAASLVDALVDCKRVVIKKEGNFDYNTMMFTADELGTFMHEYLNETISLLSAFYDPDPYSQHRRGKEIKIKIKRPQLTMLCGTTPSNLLKFIPDSAWDQGFMSRVIMVYSNEHIPIDIWNARPGLIDKDLVHDLKAINSLYGQFRATTEYQQLVNAWRDANYHPTPNHPKLMHYNTRRLAHLFKLSMISSADKGDSLLLGRDDFIRAHDWLINTEAMMPDIFKAGAPGADAKAMEEIVHYIATVDKGKGVPEHSIMMFASARMNLLNLTKVLGVMEATHMIRPVAVDKYGTKIWKATSSTAPHQ
jgi:hypothetical protein